MRRWGYLPPLPCTWYWPRPTKETSSHPGSLPQLPARGQARLDPGQEEEGAEPLPQTRHPTQAPGLQDPLGETGTVEAGILIKQQFHHLLRPSEGLGQQRASWRRGDPQGTHPQAYRKPYHGQARGLRQADPDSPPAATHRTGQCAKAAGAHVGHGQSASSAQGGGLL